jgi:transcriptional regulator GlxA family with amidase domain
MRKLAVAVCTLLALAAAALASFAFTLPSARPRLTAGAAVPDSERGALLATLRPTKRARPVIAVLAHNDGTETTDFLVPYGVLRASGAAEVVAVALRDAPVTLMPALRVRAELDFAGFDARYPEGADYVIAPALHRADDPAVTAWLAAQARSGATAIGICDGAWVLAAAGLLDGRTATTHWFSRDRLQKTVPGMTWARDRRYVADRGVVTTSGVSASLPLALTLVEAIAGRARATELAQSFGVSSWDASHASGDFVLDRPALLTAVANALSPWRHETVDLRLEPNLDLVSLAFTADAYARTYLSHVRSVAAAPEVTSRQGLLVLADAVTPANAGAEIALPPAGSSALDAALAGVTRRYGSATADFVALQLEYEPH